MLTENNVKLIRESASELAMMDLPATNTFYSNLFAEVPAVRELFPEDMFVQSEKLWKSIVIVVEAADDLSQIEGALKELGARHVQYGAEPAHYPIVSRILIETIAKNMADRWTNAHQKAWADALEQVCATMLEGAKEVTS